jgi:hypothetical protein
LKLIDNLFPHAEKGGSTAPVLIEFTVPFLEIFLFRKERGSCEVKTLKFNFTTFKVI